MKKYFLITAALFAALSLGFVSCENPDDDPGFSLESVGQEDADDKNDANSDGTTPSTPEKPTLIATGDVTNLAEKSATFWGRLNADTLWALPNVKWGVEYAYDREAVSQHKHQETTKVNCTAGLQGANMDEFSVTIDGLQRSQTIYYSAYILINDMKYVYGEVDSVHIVKLTLKPNSSDFGTVTGSGYYDIGAEATITATPNRVAYFVKWNDENTDNPRTLTVTGNLELTAIFDCAYVDLGLSVKWAPCNVGATSPEEYGDYYAWGETESKTTYDWNTYKWATATWTYNGRIGYYYWDLETLTKYNTDSDYGTVDNKTVLDPEDDAARANWGGAWRMPTDAECTELLENCTWTWTDDYNGTGVKGRIVTSKINGNSIFLPATSYSESGYCGFYWSSSLRSDSPRAGSVNFYSHNVSGDGYSRCYDLSVRPVLGE